MEKPMRTMIDSSGTEVPIRYVSAYDKLRDKTTRKILARFLKARKMLEDVVKESIADLDGLIQVSIDQQYNIQLDERVAKARELMLEYVKSEIARLDKNTVFLRKVVEDAFRADAKGYLPISAILKLTRYEVPDERWNEARGILQDSLTPVPGKRYLNCAVRDSKQHDFKTSRLDIADCWPVEPAE